MSLPRQVLTVRDLAVSARHGGVSRPLLHGVDLDLAAGEVVGIVGESGSGKSTLCRALARILPQGVEVERGSALMGDFDLLHAPASEVHRRAGGVGMIFQEPRAALNPVIRIGDQLVEALRAHRTIGKTEARRQILQLLTRIGIPDPGRRLSLYPHEFSGGQCQRLVTAVALVGNPSVLFADEPTSALDVTTQAQILQLLGDLARDREIGIVLVSHNYAVVAQLCPRTIVMYAGRVLEAGPTAELLSRPRHPYTRALIGSLPDIDKRVPELAAIPGRPPAPWEASSGCPFRSRCSYAREVCATDGLPLIDLGAGHHSACKRTAEIWPGVAEHRPLVS